MSLALRLVLVALLSTAAAADDIVPRDWLVIEPVDGVGRRPVRPDAVFATHLLERDAAPPEEGGGLTGEQGQQRWKRREADEGGRVAGPVGYAYTTIGSDVDRVMIADVRGALTVYVNGSAHMADLYGYGFGGVPVALEAGTNHVYVHVRRGGGFSMTLREPDADLMVVMADTTAPDLLAGQAYQGEAAVLVMNATTEAMGDIRVESGGANGFAHRESGDAVSLPPLGVTKLTIALALEEGLVLEETGPVRLPVRLSAGGGSSDHDLELAVRRGEEAHRITFRSRIDDSVQQYALLRPLEDVEEPGLVLSLHGAGVDCLAQARAYAPKKDLAIVAPTNRRPFGFDWQDWGRQDAMEVLGHAGLSGSLRNTFPRWYLTGHSMGGHGTWHLAVNSRGVFKAIAPSAGWCSFDTYGGRPEGQLADLWHAADGASHTLELLSNLADTPVYIVHGTADDNVPADQARLMEQALVELGHPPRTHYEEGAGHWWDGEASDGADCVDWPGVFELFAEKPRPQGASFTSWDPSVSDQGGQCRAVQPLRYGEAFGITTTVDPEAGVIAFETRNVRSFATGRLAQALGSVVVDGQEFGDVSKRAFFVREGEGSAWRLGEPVLGEKTGRRGGPFKRAFDNEFVLVYGTAGTDEETRELLERARYDAQVWWYRGNGRAPILGDREFVDRWLQRERNNVILYGNADTNAAWEPLLGVGSPIQVTRESVRIGDDEWTGDDLGCVFVRPRGERTYMVGVVANTGVRGARLGYTLQPFVSGVGYPDYTAFSSRVLTEGDGGVVAAGWFDHAWKLDGRGFRAAER